MNKIKKWMMENWIIIILMIISIMHFFIVQKLPILAFPSEVYDDQLMVKLSKSMIEGNWLGEYDSNTFIKRPGFPIFLGLLKIFPISYLFVLEMFYILACWYFIYAIKADLKHKWITIPIFAFLLFNPISYGAWTYQRVYRNGPGIFQAIFIFSGMYILYKKRGESIRQLLPHSILVGVMQAFLMHSREDSMWILPFMTVASIVTIVFMIVDNFIHQKNYSKMQRKSKTQLSNGIFENKKRIIVKSCIIVLPIIMVIMSAFIIKIINYNHYGVFAMKEKYYNKVLELLYQVKSPDEVQYVDNTRRKIEKLYEVSPSLAGIQTELEASLDVWSAYDRHPEDKEVENGWFSWAFKDAVQNAGYYRDAKTSNEFHKKIYDEIKTALEEGRLEKQDTMLIPSLPAWRKGYLSQIFSEVPKFLKFIVCFDDIKASNEVSLEGSGVADLKVSDFEFVTSHFAVKRSSSNIRICGWYFLNDKKDYTLYLTNENGQKISEVSRIESGDLVSAFGNENAEKSRFDFVLVDIENIASFEKLYLSSYDVEEKLIESISLESYVQNQIVEGENSKYCLSLVSIDTRRDPIQEYSNHSVTILNRITKVYSWIGPIVSILGFISYLMITIRMVMKTIKNKKLPKDFDVWLILTGILLSFMVMLLGIIYTHITFCNTLIYMYLAVEYPLLMMFSLFAIFYMILGDFGDPFQNHE